jgi:hypothetical protein
VKVGWTPLAGCGCVGIFAEDDNICKETGARGRTDARGGSKAGAGGGAKTGDSLDSFSFAPSCLLWGPISSQGRCCAEANLPPMVWHILVSCNCLAWVLFRVSNRVRGSLVALDSRLCEGGPRFLDELSCAEL